MDARDGAFAFDANNARWIMQKLEAILRDGGNPLDHKLWLDDTELNM